METVNFMKKEMEIGSKVIKRCPICYSRNIHVDDDEVYIDHSDDSFYIYEVCCDCGNERRIEV